MLIPARMFFPLPGNLTPHAHDLGADTRS